MPPTNLLIVATVLKNAGFKVNFIDAAFDANSFVNLCNKIGTYDAVVILTSTNSFIEDCETLAELKQGNPSLKTIVFGSHPTFMPQQCLRQKVVDFIIRGEPEYIIRDLIRSLADENNAWHDLKGIGYNIKGGAIINEPYPFIEDLDSLPIPDRSLLSDDTHYFNPAVKRMPYTVAQTSRGCPGKCIFCTVPEFYGKRVRFRSSGSVIEELEQIVSLGYKEVFFRDETFTYFKQRNEIICRHIIDNKIDLTWIANARVGTVDENSLRLFKQAGCHLIKFGVESGDQKILDNIGKGINLEQTRRDFALTRRLGIDTHAHIMLGNVGETKSTIQATVDFVKEIDPSTVSFGICTPYPGTELFRRVASKVPDIADGTASSLSDLHTKSFFSNVYTDLSVEELECSVQSAYRQFYLRPGYIYKKFKSLNSIDEFKRVLLASLNIFDFIFRGDR